MLKDWLTGFIRIMNLFKKHHTPKITEQNIPIHILNGAATISVMNGSPINISGGDTVSISLDKDTLAIKDAALQSQLTDQQEEIKLLQGIIQEFEALER